MTCSALVFGAALHPLTPAAPLAGGALGLVTGAVFAYRTAVRRLIAGGAVRLALSAAAVVLAAWATRRIAGAEQTAAWPPLVVATVAAAAMGLVGALAALPGHCSLVGDPVRGALRRLPADLDPEIRALCDRAAAIWATARTHIADRANAELVRSGVASTLEVAIQSAELEITGASDADLAARVAELDRRIAGASDADAAAQYRAARGALADQQRYRQHIRQRRERLVARMHNHLASLEKFELAATGLEAARAVAPATSELEARASEAATTGDALAEVAALPDSALSEADSTAGAAPAKPEGAANDGARAAADDAACEAVIDAADTTAGTKSTSDGLSEIAALG